MKFLLFICIQFVTSILYKPVYVALKQRNIDVLKSELAERSNPLSSMYGNWMTVSEINTYINPPIEDQYNVLDWIHSNNITSVHNYGDSILFTASRLTLEYMLKLETVDQLTGYTIPDHLTDIIEFVEMSSNVIDRKSKINVTTNVHTADDRYFGREPLINMYNITSNIVSNVSVGLIEYQNNEGFLPVDLSLQQAANNQTSNNISIIVGRNYGSDTESELDVQLVSQAADGAQLWYWQAQYWLYSFAVDYFNAEASPDIVSMSWGWSQNDQCSIMDCGNLTSKQYVDRVNNEYLKISLLGKTIVVASGDAGAPGRTNEECGSSSPINPVFPGSSPYVLSVGATFVPVDASTHQYDTPMCKNNTCITRADEKAVRFDRVGWTGGGGFDRYETSTPVWQKKAVDQYLTSGVTLPIEQNYNRHGRAYPDVSAIGHSCPTYIDGSLGSVDGTSCSAPVMAGLLTYINQYLWTTHRIKLGFANPLLYYIFDNCPQCFKDITDGYNWCTESMCCTNKTDYGFSAIKGYDPVSGLGTLNIGNILDFLEKKLP